MRSKLIIGIEKARSFFADNPALSLLILLVAFSFFYQYQDILFLRPQSNHTGRQCDCLSFTLNYYKENVDFFHPIVHYCDSNGSVQGITECPLLYYGVAQLWKVFGYHEYIYRSVVLLIFFSSLFALQRMCISIFKSVFWATWLTAFFFTSGVLVYYANNFLVDVPALSFSIFGWYFFMKYYHSKKNKHFGLSILFFIIAGLLKISAMISIAAIIFVYLREKIGKKKTGRDDQELFSKKWFYLIGFLTLILVVGSWYMYSSSYSAAHHSMIYLNGILPIWEMDLSAMAETGKLLFRFLNESVFNSGGLILSVVLTVLIFIYRRSIPNFFFIVICVMNILFIVYLLLFYQVFNVHDYYLINMMIVFIFIFIGGILILKSRSPKLERSRWFRSAMFLFLLISAIQCGIKLRWKYFKDGSDKIASYCMHQNEIDFYRWLRWYQSDYFSAFGSIETYDRSLGIKREDQVIVYGDVNATTTLYLMDQKGYTDFGPGTATAEVIQEYIDNGAKYLFVFDSTMTAGKEYLQPFLQKRFGSYKNITIYDLRK